MGSKGLEKERLSHRIRGSGEVKKDNRVCRDVPPVDGVTKF